MVYTITNWRGCWFVVMERTCVCRIVCVYHVFDCGSDDTTCNAFELFIFYGVPDTDRRSGTYAAKIRSDSMAENSRKSQLCIGRILYTDPMVNVDMRDCKWQ